MFVMSSTYFKRMSSDKVHYRWLARNWLWCRLCALKDSEVTVRTLDQLETTLLWLCADRQINMCETLAFKKCSFQKCVEVVVCNKLSQYKHQTYLER